VQFRNNLFVGDSWKVPVFDMRTSTNYSTSDYNGFGPNAGVANNFGWSSPAPGTVADYEGRPVVRRFATLAEYQAGSGQDGHSVQVGLHDFVKVGPTDQADPPHLYNPEDYDFSLKPESVAIDHGMELATITDGFAGRAPDLGALEFGKSAPHYGPERWPVGAATSSTRSFTGPPR
jgi:hypothetical protein